MGTFMSQQDGYYLFRTVKPEYYSIPIDGYVGDLLNILDRHPFRPAHVYFMLKAHGYKVFLTHAFNDRG